MITSISSCANIAVVRNKKITTLVYFHDLFFSWPPTMSVDFKPLDAAQVHFLICIGIEMRDFDKSAQIFPSDTTNELKTSTGSQVARPLLAGGTD